MSGIYLATYSSGGVDWRRTAERLVRQAVETEWFKGVFNLNETFLNKDFCSRYADILHKRKGAGYWIWKPHIIQRCLSYMAEGDILFYLDSGCTINIHGQSRFRDYIEMLGDGKSGSLAFQLDQVEKWWSVRQVFEYFGVGTSSYIANSGQLVGGIFGIKKNYQGQSLIREVLTALSHDPLMFTDNYSSEAQIECFRQNRHDQSVFSIARKIMGSDILADETSHYIYGNEHSKKFPFWATRIKPDSLTYKSLSGVSHANKKVIPSSDLVCSLQDLSQALGILGLGIGRITEHRVTGGEER